MHTTISTFVNSNAGVRTR